MGRTEDRQLHRLGALARWMLDLDSRAIFVLDASANVILSNTAAKALFCDDGWGRLVRGKLAFAAASLQGWLLASIASKAEDASLMCGSMEGRTLLSLRHIRGAGALDDDLFMLAIGDPAVVSPESNGGVPE